MKTKGDRFAKMVGELIGQRRTQLVDIYLAWAQLRGFETALFVIKCYRNGETAKKAESDLIKQHAATHMQHGLNGRS